MQRCFSQGLQSRGIFQSAKVSSWRESGGQRPGGAARRGPDPGPGMKVAEDPIPPPPLCPLDPGAPFCTRSCLNKLALRSSSLDLCRYSSPVQSYWRSARDRINTQHFVHPLGNRLSSSSRIWHLLPHWVKPLR